MTAWYLKLRKSDVDEVYHLKNMIGVQQIFNSKANKKSKR